MYSHARHVRIEICGGIGVGKSTFASRLASRLPTSELICENFRANPLWNAYYEAPSKFVREKNISFLAQHFAEIKHAVAPVVISDFCTLQDLAYANLTADPEHERIMREVHSHLQNEVRPPTFVVHLVSSVERQLQQISTRGRPEEAILSGAALSALNQALSRVLENSVAPQSLKEIDISARDLRTDTVLLDQLLEQLLDSI